MPGAGGGTIPDLARANDGIYQLLPQIVLQGIFASQGMPSFSGKIAEQDVQDIKAYLLFTAQALRSGMESEAFVQRLANLQKLADEKR